MKNVDLEIRKVPSTHEIRWFRSRLLEWYLNNERNFPWRVESATQYQRIVAELLLQRTRAQSVAAFFPKFVQRFPSWNELANASAEDLQSFLMPLGLWRRRALSISALAREISGRQGRFPRKRSEIEALPGVGQYLANAVQLFCHGKARPLLDVNAARVLERYFGPRKLADIRDDPFLQATSTRIVGEGDAIAINFALIDHAALVCRQSQPLCAGCPIVSYCKFKKFDRMRQP